MRCSPGAYELAGREIRLKALAGNPRMPETFAGAVFERDFILVINAEILPEIPPYNT